MSTMSVTNERLPIMDTTKESLAQTESNSYDMKDVDEERYKVACLWEGIFDEYETTSTELFAFLKNMEAEFKHQQRGYEEQEAILRQENTFLKDELSRGSQAAKDPILLPKTRAHQGESQENESALDILKNKTRLHEWNYQMEHNRAEELKAFVDNLQLELQRAEEVALQQKKRLEQSTKRMERKNQELRRQAALGWMLGCLSDLYLRVDPKVDGASIIKLVRQVQLELESGGNMFNGRDLSPLQEYEAIQRELHRLLGISCTTPLRNAAQPCNIAKESASRCVKSCKKDDQEASPRRRRKQWQKYSVSDPDAIKVEDLKRPITSPLILEGVQNDGSQKTSKRSTVSEIQIMDNAQIAQRDSRWDSETVELLKGLEKSMSFIISKF